MNNSKALPGCFRGSRQLGQTLVSVFYIKVHTSTLLYNFHSQLPNNSEITFYLFTYLVDI